MAKHRLYLHIGPSAAATPDGMDAEARARLAGAGVQVPDVTSDDLDRADTEIRRRHKAVGLRRKDVEGAWARVCRRVFRTRSDAFVSLPGFWDADADQAALALDGLHGLKVHLVVTADACEVPASWAQLVKPGRVHALRADLGPTGVAEQVAGIALADGQARPVRIRRRRPKVDDRDLAA